MLLLGAASGCVRLDYDAPPRPPATNPGDIDAAARAGDSGLGSGAAMDAAVRDGGALVSDAAYADDAKLGDADADSAAHAAPQPAMDSGAHDASPTPMSIDASAPDAGYSGGDDSNDSKASASSDDSLKDAGATRACSELSNVVFCDGFEDVALANWTYEVVQNGTLARSTVRAHSGSASMRATTGAPSANNAARKGVRAFDHVESGDLWVRYYYYVPNTVVISPSFSTVVVAEIEQPYFGFSLLDFGTQVNLGVLGAMYDGTAALAKDRWTCVELHVQIAASGGRFEAYLDGTLAVRTRALATLPAMGYTSLDVGIHYTDPKQGPVEAFVDDVAASTSRIGCD